MFEKKGEFFTNKDEEFLKNSDLIIYWNATPKEKEKNFVVIGGSDEKSKVDVPKSSEKLPLLFARLAYVFRIVDEKLEDDEAYEEFVELLKSVRVKKEILRHDSTLEEISGVLYLIDEAKQVSVVIDDIDEEEFETLMSFLALVGLLSDKIGVFSKEDVSWYKEFYFYE